MGVTCESCKLGCMQAQPTVQAFVSADFENIDVQFHNYSLQLLYALFIVCWKPKMEKKCQIYYVYLGSFQQRFKSALREYNKPVLKDGGSKLD